jgi:hypothetical protein
VLAWARPAGGAGRGDETQGSGARKVVCVSFYVPNSTTRMSTMSVSHLLALLGQETANALVAKRSEGVIVRLAASAAHAWDLSGLLPLTYLAHSPSLGRSLDRRQTR